MKISQLVLNNFRQFYGRQTLELAYDDVQNVTVIHAENGVGKTTLLNAIYWTFFGRVTERFEQPDQLVNFTAQSEGTQSSAIDVRFEFDRVDYIAQRRSQRSGSTPFTVAKIESGAMRPLHAPETFIDSIIPMDMARYFFFDGEHAERFAAYGNVDAGPAIRAMLGCDMAERAVKDLTGAASYYIRQIGNAPGDDEASQLQAQLAQSEQEQERDGLALADHRRTIEELKAQKLRIEDELRRTQESRAIQILRDTLQDQLAGVEQSLRSAEAEVVRWIGRASTVAVVGRRLADATLDFIDEEALRGRIPSPYNETFIQGLLSSEKCICGCELRPQSAAWQAVADLLRSAGSAVALNRAVRARAQLSIMKANAEAAPGQLQAAQSKVSQELEKRRKLEQEIGEQNRKLENFSIDEVREREEARGRIERRIEALSREIGTLESSMGRRARLIADRIAEIQRFAERSERARRILRRNKLALRAAEVLRVKLGVYETEARKEIEADVNDILDRVARRNYRFKFDDEFGMNLLYADTNRSVPRSAGENQLVSLAFTAALLRFAKSRVEVESAVLAPGTVAPLVLDAPFGQLDRHYKAATASFVPEMAGQVVLLLSSSQATPEVMEALRPRIGVEYVLISNNTGPRGDRVDDAIELHGRQIIRSRFNQDRAMTEIEMVLS